MAPREEQAGAAAHPPRFSIGDRNGCGGASRLRRAARPSAGNRGL